MHYARLPIMILVLTLLIAACAQPTNVESLPVVTLRGERFVRAGQTFFMRGTNFVRATGVDRDRCWSLQFGADPRCPWDMTAIEADLARLQARGVNTIRVFLNYYVFGGQANVNPEYLPEVPKAHFDDLLAAANRRGIYVIPVLLIDYPQDQFAPQFWQGALDRHVRPVVRRYADHPGIIAWDLYNEPDIGSPIDIRCWDWDNADFPGCFPLAEARLAFLQQIAAETKRIDPGTPLTISVAFAKSYFEPAEAQLRLADMVDFYAFHYYDRDPYDSGRYQAHWYYGKGFPADLRRAITELQVGIPPRPIVITELGFPSDAAATRDAAGLRRDLATALRVAVAERTAGLLIWSFQETIAEAPGNLFLP